MFNTKKLPSWLAGLVRAFAVVALLFVAAGAFAQSEPGNNLVQGTAFDPKEIIPQVMEKDFNPQDEWVHRWFQQTFGSFIFEPFGGPVNSGEITLLSYGLGFTNILALFLGLVFVFNIYLVGAINTAHQGEVLGQKFSTAWVPIRVASGFMLILPMKGVGGGVFSIIQMILIWLLIVSSNMATYLWDSMADLMLEGAPVNSVPNTATLDPSAHMLKMLICAELSLQNKSSNASSSADSKVYAEYTEGGIAKKLWSTNMLPSGGANTINKGAFTALRGKPLSRITFANGSCGAIDFRLGQREDNILHFLPRSGNPLNDGRDDALVDGAYSGSFYNEVLTDTFGNNYKKRMFDNGQAAVSARILNHLEELLPFAQAIVYERDSKVFNFSAGGASPALGGGDFIVDKLNEDEDEAFKAEYEGLVDAWAIAADNYASGLPGTIKSAILDDSQLGTQWKKDMTLGGWGGAGRWYMEMNSYISLVAEVMKIGSSNIGAEGNAALCADADSSGWFDNCDDLEENLSDSIQVVDAIKSLAVKKSLPEMNRMKPQYIASSWAICNNGLDCHSQSLNVLDSGWSDRISQSVINYLGSSHGYDMTDTRGIVNPFRAVSEFGHNLNDIGVTAITVVSTLNALKWAVDKVSASVGLLNIIPTAAEAKAATGGAIAGLLSNAVSVLLALSISLITLGSILAYLIPFMPLFIWVNMVASYLVTAVEVVVASPLGVVQMITPEGEGISGTRLERFYALIAAAVLRPSLMIIGLLASITLGAVIFSIFNIMFWSTAMMLLHTSLLGSLALIVLYVMGAYQITKTIAMIMPKLPEQIMEWFSSGVGRGFGENEVSHTMEGAIGNMQGRITGIGDTIKNAVKEK